MKLRQIISLILISVAIIAYQLNIMQIFSIMQWYHFAYMVIAVALMGFGTAGTFLAIFRQYLLKKFECILPWIMLLSGISMSAVIALAQLPVFRFDSYLLFSNSSHIFKLIGTYLLFIIPFFFAALAIGLIFIRYVELIGKLYFANLLGSGLGGFAAIILILIFYPAEISGIIGIFPILASIFVFNKKDKALFSIIVFFAIGFAVFFSLFPFEITLSQFKSLSKTKNLPNSEVILRKNSPYGLIEVISSPALRYAPGLSLTYTDKLGAVSGLFINGDWSGPLINLSNKDSLYILDYTPAALPYRISKRENVLILNSGTGKDVQHSLANNTALVTAVEANGTLISLLQNELAGYIDSAYNGPSVLTKITEPRTYLFTDKKNYDLIILPELGAFGGTSGLYAIQENYLLTIESFNQMWNKLTDNGAICVTSWLDYPYRNSLKLLAAITEVLFNAGINNPVNHIASVRGWGTITFVFKKTPLTSGEINSVKDFCNEMLFDPVILPGFNKDELSQYNILQDEKLFDYVDIILSNQRKEFIEQYDFNIKPPTDNRPYFSQFIKWKSLPHLAELFGSDAVPFFEIGYIIVVITFFQIAVFVFALILLPLFKISSQREYRLWTVLYFSGIGIGYMFVEIVLIQKFILYFGNPVYSVAAVIAFMLICSGAGSYYSSNFNLERRVSLKVFGIIILLLLLYSFLLTPILQSTISALFLIKIIIAFFIIGFPAFAMGLPFPLGLRFINLKNDSLTPWAWGINGSMSVLSTVLAVIFAVELGFSLVIIFAAGAYMISLFSGVRNKN